MDPNPMPPGIYQYSVVVTTPHREMKFTAPTKERHDIWVNVSVLCLRCLYAQIDEFDRLCNISSHALAPMQVHHRTESRHSVLSRTKLNSRKPSILVILRPLLALKASAVSEQVGQVSARIRGRPHLAGSGVIPSSRTVVVRSESGRARPQWNTCDGAAQMVRAVLQGTTNKFQCSRMRRISSSNSTETRCQTKASRAWRTFVRVVMDGTP